MLNVRYSEKQAKTLSKMNTRLKLDIKKRRQAETELIKSEENSEYFMSNQMMPYSFMI